MIDIEIALDGKVASFTMPYDEGNKRWLWRALGGTVDAFGDVRPPRRPTRPEYRDGRWHTTKAGAWRIFNAATAEGRTARLTRWFRPDTERCTSSCQVARPDTYGECTCVCGGERHGERSAGWVPIGDHLLVRKGGEGPWAQTITNGC
jgi:hypothetical protein